MTRGDKKILITALCLLLSICVMVGCNGGLHNEEPDADESKRTYTERFAEEESNEENSSVRDIVTRYVDAVAIEEATEEVHTDAVAEVVTEYVDSGNYVADTGYLGSEYLGSDEEEIVLGEEHIYDEPTVISNDVSNDGGTDNSASVTEVTEAGLSEEEIWQIARITWLETGVCSYYTQYLCACVLINRLYGWGYNNIYEVIQEDFDGEHPQYATAYQYTNWGEDVLTISNTTWEAVYDAIEYTDPNPYYQCGYTDAHTLYYVDTAWDVYFYYDD